MRTIKITSVTILHFVFNVKALISIARVIESTPQSFGQSFSSSSVVKPNGQVISSSIYTDSKGNKVVNGKNPPAIKVPDLFNDLLPPLAPGESFNFGFQPLPPFAQPSFPVVKPAAVVTTRTTARPAVTVKTTTRTTPRPSVTVKTTSRPVTTTRRLVTTARQAAVKVNNSPNEILEGAYVHDNAGAYVHDDRGAYKPS